MHCRSHHRPRTGLPELSRHAAPPSRQAVQRGGTAAADGGGEAGVTASPVTDRRALIGLCGAVQNLFVRVRESFGSRSGTSPIAVRFGRNREFEDRAIVSVRRSDLHERLSESFRARPSTGRVTRLASRHGRSHRRRTSAHRFTPAIHRRRTGRRRTRSTKRDPRSNRVGRGVQRRSCYELHDTSESCESGGGAVA